MSNNGGPAFPTGWTNTGDQNRTAPNGTEFVELPSRTQPINFLVFLIGFHREAFRKICEIMQVGRDEFIWSVSAYCY